MRRIKWNLVGLQSWLPAVSAAGLAVCLTGAGFTPGRIVTNAFGLGSAVGLLAFWLAVMSLATACFALLARRVTAIDRRWSWPWSGPETVVAVTLAGAVLAISRDTMPANFIKYSWLQGMLLLLAGTLVYSRSFRRGMVCARYHRAMAVPFVLLLGYWLLRIAVSAETVRGAEALTRLWALAGWFLLLSCALSRGPALRLLFLWLVMLGVLVSGYGCAQYAGYDAAEWGRGFSLPDLDVVNRAMGTFGNPNFLGAFLAIVLPIPLAVLLRVRERWQAGACTAGLIVLGAGMVLTYNRAGYLAAGAACGVVLFCLRRGKIRWRWLVLPVLAGALIAPASVWDRVFFWQHGLRGDDTVRLAIWQGTMNMVMSRPLFGSGLGTFNQALVPHLPPAFHEIFPRPLYVIEHAHSEWLEFWAETGSCGLLLLLAALAALARMLWHRHRADPDDVLPVLGLAALTAAVIHGLLETKLRYESTAVPLLFIIAAALAPEPAPSPARNQASGWRRQVLTGMAMLFALLPALLCLSANQLSKSALDNAMLSNPSAAAEALIRAVACNPENVAVNYQAIGFLTGAQVPAGLAGFTPPRSPSLLDYQDAALGLARLAAKRQAWEEAIGLLEHYAARYPYDAHVPLLRAKLFLSAGKPVAALEVLNRPSFALPVAPDEVNALRLEILEDLGWQRVAARWASLLSQRMSPLLVRKRLTSAVKERQWQTALACLIAIMPDYRDGNIPGQMREQVERLVNGISGEPGAGDKYLIPIGDLLVAARQYPQARMVYQFAGTHGTAPEIVHGRLAWLGLTTDNAEVLAAAAQYFLQCPGWVDTGRYLLGRWLEMQAAAGEPSGHERAIVAYRGLVEQERPHLGALFRLQHMAAARRPEIAGVVRAAELRLGVNASGIDNSDPRWAVAVTRSVNGAGDSVNLRVTPVLPCGETEWRVVWSADSVPVQYGRGRRFTGASGQTAALVLPQLEPEVMLTMPVANAVAVEAKATGTGDVRPPGRWSIGGLAAQAGDLRRLPVGNLAAGRVLAAMLAQEPWRRTVWPGGKQRELPMRLSWWRTLVGEPQEFLSRVLQLSSQSPPAYGGGLLAWLDELVSAGRQEIPGFLWQRPRRWGITGDYWRRWQGTWLWRHQDFRCAIGELLVEEQRWPEAIDWLRSDTQPAPQQRWLHARALTGSGDRAAAAAVFAGAAPAERSSLPGQWYYGQWRKLVGLPYQEQVAALAAGGADGWAWRLRGERRRPGDLATPVRFEGGVQVVAIAPVPRILRAGALRYVRIDFIADHVLPGIAMQAVSQHHRLFDGDSSKMTVPGKIDYLLLPVDGSLNIKYDNDVLVLLLATDAPVPATALLPITGVQSFGQQLALGPMTILPAVTAAMGD